MDQVRQINEELLADLIAKYRGIFDAGFQELTLNVHFTLNGQPPDAIETVDVTGAFFNNDRDYQIGINQNQVIPLKVLTLFHELGHALYRARTNKPILDEHAQTLTETAALLKSLELACAENLPTIVALALTSAVELAKNNPMYRKALENAKDDPLFVASIQRLLR